MGWGRENVAAFRKTRKLLYWELTCDRKQLQHPFSLDPGRFLLQLYEQLVPLTFYGLNLFDRAKVLSRRGLRVKITGAFRVAKIRFSLTLVSVILKKTIRVVPARSTVNHFFCFIFQNENNTN